MLYHLVYIVFLFALGACIGSFLNVVVWRLPRGESLSTPPSHCPRCDKTLRWYDNVPIVGWIKLGGKCRYCRAPISVRYPIVEAVTALLFVFYYVMFYMSGAVETCPPMRLTVFADAAMPSYVHAPLEWPFFGLYLFLISALLAASLIDAELFEIPYQIPLLVALVAVVFHAILDRPHLAGSLNLVRRPDGSAHPAAALAAGGMIGLGLSWLLMWRGVLRRSFPEGEPIDEPVSEAEYEEITKARAKQRKAASNRDTDAAELDEEAPVYTARHIRREMGMEVLFLLPPILLAVGWLLLTEHVASLRSMWMSANSHHWVTGLLGALFGGLVGGAVVWLTRILGTLGFGRLAMGLGDVDLMFAVGAVLGAGAATVAFFLSPFFGLVMALYMIVTGKRRELPYGPYLSLGAACVMLTYCPIEQWLTPGLEGLKLMLGGQTGG